MRSLPAPVEDADRVYDEVAASKREPTRGRLEAIRECVLGAYATYEAGVGDSDLLIPIPMHVDSAAALRSAYEQPTKPLNELKDRLQTDEAVAQCPYCNIPEAPTIDHYLPIEKFPEYAVMPLNLVPCCWWCNGKKRTLIMDQDTRVRSFIHPYFDAVTANGFLAVAVNLLSDAIGLRFFVRPTDGLTKEEFAQVSSHFDTLGLADRYRRMALAHVRDNGAAYERRFLENGLGADVANDLNGDAAHLTRLYGPSHWKAVLCKALGEDDAFCGGGFRALMDGRSQTAAPQR